MKNTYFDGWYVYQMGHNPTIPWEIMIPAFVIYFIFMAIITAMCRGNSRVEELIHSVEMGISFESGIKRMVIPFSVLMAISRSLYVVEFNLVTIIISIGSFTFAVLDSLRIIKTKYVPYLYFTCIAAISSLVSWHHHTPIFVVPEILGLLAGYFVGTIDAKNKQQIEKMIS